MLLYLITPEGCASLPRTQDFLFNYPTDPLRIIGPQGELSQEEADAVVSRFGEQLRPAGLLWRQIAQVKGVGGSPLTAGNKVTLFTDGYTTYRAMCNSILNASDHINMETYTIGDDEIGRRLADLLLRKRAEGVEVNLVYDGAGCFKTPAAFFKRLRDGGVRTLEFNPVNPFRGAGKWVLTHRNHKKILIVDGSVAFTGSVNIRSANCGSRSDGSCNPDIGEPWRDAHVRIEGPVVAEFQKLFLDTWSRGNGHRLSVEGRNFFPPLKQEGNDLVQIVASSPGKKNRSTYMMYLSAIIHARKSVRLTSPYFVPDEQTMRALTDAASRGVDVQIILPGACDSSFSSYAGRSIYARLLRSGVKIYECRGAMLHTKSAVIDGVWSTIGSTNLDLWSFLRNDELNAVVVGEQFAEELEEMFLKDLGESDPVRLDEWEKRPISKRAREWLAWLIKYWL